MANLSGVDVSHYQGSPDWSAVRRAGHQFAVLKTTESTNYTDPSMPANRANAHAAGLVVGFYHFARGGSPAAEANYFLSRIGTLAGDEFACLDWEISPAGVDPAAWCAAWCAAVAARTGRQPFIYLNGPRIARSDWSPLVQAGVRLWLAGDGVNASYDNNPTIPAVKWWGVPTIKQYTESGQVPGISGGVDLNVLSGALAELTNGDDMLTDEQAHQLSEAYRLACLAASVKIVTPASGEQTPGEQVAALIAPLTATVGQLVEAVSKLQAASPVNVQAFADQLAIVAKP